MGAAEQHAKQVAAYDAGRCNTWAFAMRGIKALEGEAFAVDLMKRMIQWEKNNREPLSASDLILSRPDITALEAMGLV